MPFNIEDYGAVGDGVTDDSTAFEAAGAAINLAGGGTVNFRSAANYVVRSSYSASPLMDLSACTGIKLKFNGCKLTVPFIFGDGQQMSLFRFTDCSQIKLGSVNIITNTPLVYDNQRGIISFTFTGSGYGVRVHPITQVGGRMGFWFIRYCNTDAVSRRMSNIRIDGMKCSAVNYPLILSHSGDDVEAKIEANGCGRPFFISGVKNVRVKAKAKEQVNQCMITSYNETTINPGVGTILNDDPICENIDASLTVVPAQISHPMTDYSIVLQAHGPNPCTLRNIRVSVNITNGVYPETGIIATIKTNNGVLDTIPSRGHIFDNVDVSGSAVGVPDLSAAQNLIGIMPDTTWSGETMRNFHLHDFIVSGSTNNSISCHLPSFVNGPMFSRVDSDAALVCVGNPGAGLAFYNTRFDGQTNAIKSESAQVGRMGVNESPQSYTRLYVQGDDEQVAAFIKGSPNDGKSFGLLVTAGTEPTDYAVRIQDDAGTPVFQINGDGSRMPP